MRGVLEPLADHPPNLGELVHQVSLGVQAAGGVDDHDVGAAGLSGLDRVVGDRSRVRPRSRADDLRARSFGPLGELLDRRRPVGIGGRDHHVELQLLGQVPGDLADRRRLAGAVDPDHHQHRRLGGEVDAPLPHRRQLGDDLDQPLLHRGAVGGHLSGVDVALEPLDHLGRGRRADVGEDEQLLEPLPGLLVDAIEEAGRDLLRQRLAATREALAQAAEHPAALLAVSRCFTVPTARGGIALAEVKGLLPAHRHRGRLAGQVALSSPIPRRKRHPRPVYAASASADSASSGWSPSAAIAGGMRRETTLETPSAPMLTP